MVSVPVVFPLSDLIILLEFVFVFGQIGNFGHEEMLKQQCSSIWGRQMPVKQQGFQSNGGYERQLGFSESAWPPVQIQRQNHLNQPPQHRGGSGMRAVFLGGSGVKRECAGTGVFLPRGYGINNPSECRRKSGNVYPSGLHFDKCFAFFLG